MKNKFTIGFLRCSILFFILLVHFQSFGDGNVESIRMLRPPSGDSLSYDQGKLFLVSVAKAEGENLVLSTQWREERVFDLNTRGSKENFAKDFYRLIPPRSSIQSLVSSFKLFKGFTKPETLSFHYLDTMSIRSFWQQKSFTTLVRNVQSTNSSEILITVCGWQDTVISAVYEDPTMENRWLYKLHVQLIPGANDVYFSIPEKRSEGLRYSTTFVNDTKSVESRENRFHNSKLEESCVSCHEGLPSANDGKSMKADCAVCHKSKIMAKYLHGPAEMKECTSCHGWSVEKKAVTVESGVPGACYVCHDDKQKQVENSPVPHPVASECLTCHSPHGTENMHFLKVNTYTLCKSCHEDQKMNHPVGRHPLRFTLLKNGEEIACSTCHNPHGSENEMLFKLPGGRLEMCSQCH